MNLTRYSRQTLIPAFGEIAQEKISKSRVALVGVGGVGSPAALYLAASGVGALTLIDDDVVALHNLQRQVLYREEEIGEKKVGLAKEQLSHLNSDIEIAAHDVRLNKENAVSLLAGNDIVLDGCDNFETRFIINDACIELEQPFLSVSVDRFYGEMALYHYQGSKTYRDINSSLYDDYPFRKPATRGVLGVVPGIMAMMAVTEILKILGGFGDVHSGKMNYDALSMSMTKFSF